MLSWIDIDGAALRHNVQLFNDLCGAERVAPVLKSNAYGHGLAQVYEALAPLDCEWICVNYVAEGELLRNLGYKGRLLVVGPGVAEELKRAEDCDLDMVLGHEGVVDAWLQHHPKLKVHIKVDTGMSRQGFLPRQVPAIVAKILASPVQPVAVCTHFANVEDVTSHDYANQQLSALNEAVAHFTKAGIAPMVHAASSASALLLDRSRYDLERIGISIYGFWPSQATRLSYLQTYGEVADLQPALSWRTKITTVKPVDAGQYIGYGCTFRAVQNMTVAVLPIGYFEGYPRLAGGHGSYVLIRGTRCPVVGRICMNMMMVDVSHLRDVQVEEVVTLIGHDRDEFLPAEQVATWADTIQYELVSRLHPEIPRRLLD